MTTGQNVMSLKLPLIQMFCYTKGRVLHAAGSLSWSGTNSFLFFCFFVGIALQLYVHNHKVRMEEPLS